MCIIAVQPAGDKIYDEPLLRRLWERNDHGAGYMFAEAGKLVVKKPFFTLAELMDSYKADHSNFGRTSAFVVHFRIRTHGDAGAENVHPHTLCDGEAALCHNGMLRIVDSPLSNESDTAFFCRTILGARDVAWIMQDSVIKWLGDLIGQSNKFVIMDASGVVKIVNEDQGKRDGGRWFSNNGYEDWGDFTGYGFDRGNWVSGGRYAKSEGYTPIQTGHIIGPTRPTPIIDYDKQSEELWRRNFEDAGADEISAPRIVLSQAVREWAERGGGKIPKWVRHSVWRMEIYAAIRRIKRGESVEEVISTSFGPTPRIGGYVKGGCHNPLFGV